MKNAWKRHDRYEEVVNEGWKPGATNLNELYMALGDIVVISSNGAGLNLVQ